MLDHSEDFFTISTFYQNTPKRVKVVGGGGGVVAQVILESASAPVQTFGLCVQYLGTMGTADWDLGFQKH